MGAELIAPLAKWGAALIVGLVLIIGGYKAVQRSGADRSRRKDLEDAAEERHDHEKEQEDRRVAEIDKWRRARDRARDSGRRLP